MKTRIATDPLSLDFGRDKEFCVYVYFDPRTRKKRAAIWVGKGITKVRPEVHWRHGSHNEFLNRILAKIRHAGLEPIVELVAYFDDPNDALALEAALIQRFGRRDLGLGSLCNLTDGGEGFVNIGPETRAKLSDGLRKRWEDPDYSAKMSAMTASCWADPESNCAPLALCPACPQITATLVF